LDLSFFIQGIGKRDLWLNNDLMFPINGEFSTLFDHLTDYWTPANLDAKYARLYQRASGNTGSNRIVQTAYLTNGAYMRVKNITLGYTLPAYLLRKIKLDKVRFFASGENLFTKKHVPAGIDPESTDKGNGATYPFMKMYSFGVNLNF